MNEILFDILMAVIIVLATIITKCLVPYFKAQVEDTQYAQLLEIVAMAVRAAEQTIKAQGQGKAKKAQVLAFVANWLAENNIHITEDQLDRLIEAAVYTMNKEN